MLDAAKLRAAGLPTDVIVLLIEISKTITEGEKRLKAIAATVKVSNDLAQQIIEAVAAATALEGTIENASGEAAQQVVAQLEGLREAARGFSEAAAGSATTAAGIVSGVSSRIDSVEVRLAPLNMSRGDSMVIASMDGVPLVGLAPDGTLLARFPANLGQAVAESLINARLAPTAVSRGDAIVLAEMDGVPILGFDHDGTIRARWPEELLNPPTGGGATPASPDLVGDSIDAWNVWDADGTVFFTSGQIWGGSPREYVKRGTGAPWANGPGRMRLRLGYGDAMVNLAPDRGPDRIAHVATLNDGAGQFGLAGALPGAAATDIQRAGAGYEAVVGDQWLARKAGALPWVGVRSEGVPGASLAALRTGQPMLNLRRALDQFTAVVEPYGRTVQVDAVTILHGVADDSASYAADLLQLTEDVIAQTGALRVNVFQPAGTWNRGDYASIVGTLEAFRNKGQLPLSLVSPLYWAALRAGTPGMPTAASMTMMAELEALAGLSETEWYCPIGYAATRVGTTLNVDFEVMPERALVPSSAGLIYPGASLSAPAVVAHPITGRMTRLQLTLSAAVAGTLTYRLAPTGANPAQLANFGTGLMDDWQSASVTGQTLRRHAYAFKIEVT